jgi:hypothetical protein
VLSIDRASREQTVEAPSPTRASQNSAPVTSQPNLQHTQDSNMDGVKPAVSGSFDQSMNYLRLQDDATRGSPFPREHRMQGTRRAAQTYDQTSHYEAPPSAATSQRGQGDARGGSLVTPADQAQDAHRDTHVLDELMHYHAPPFPYTNSAPKIDQDDIKGRVGISPTSEKHEQAHGEMRILDEHMEYQGAGFDDNTYQSLPGSGPLTNQEGLPFTHFAPHGFIDQTQLSMFHSFPAQMGHSYDHNMALNNMNVAYSYGRDGVYNNPMDVTMSANMSPPAATSFHGLPYEYPGSQH